MCKGCGCGFWHAGFNSIMCGSWGGIGWRDGVGWGGGSLVCALLVSMWWRRI